MGMVMKLVKVNLNEFLVVSWLTTGTPLQHQHPPQNHEPPPSLASQSHGPHLGVHWVMHGSGFFLIPSPTRPVMRANPHHLSCKKMRWSITRQQPTLCFIWSTTVRVENRQGQRQGLGAAVLSKVLILLLGAAWELSRVLSFSPLSSGKI